MNDEKVSLLISKLKELDASLSSLNQNIQGTKYVNQNIVAINESFKSIIQAISIHSSCLKRKNSPEILQKILIVEPKKNLFSSQTAEIKQDLKRELFEQSKRNNLENIPVNKLAVQGKISNAEKNTRKLEKTKGEWKWKKGIQSRIPRKYQSRNEMRKLETLLISVSNSPTGVSLSDLVRCSGLSVIQCKEMLQTLVKLEQISRKKDKTGFLYCIPWK